MKSFNYNEYFELCQKLTYEQYDDAELDKYYTWTSDESDNSVESENKEKFNKYKNQVSNPIIDLTNTKSSEIKDQILLSNKFIIGKFSIKLFRHDLDNQKFSLALYEAKNKTPNGLPCKIDIALSIYTDKRFNRCPATKKSTNRIYSLNELIEIIRWIQMVNKYNCLT